MRAGGRHFAGKRRTVLLEPTGSGAATRLSEVGTTVEVGRLSFVLDGESVLCGFGVPPL
jgi:hypothetical protein